MSEMNDIMNGLPQPMPLEDEQRLAQIIQDHPTEHHINELALSVMREAILYTGGCCHGSVPPGELFSLCWSALCKSAPRFRPGMGIRFLSYSKPDLRGELSRHWKSECVVHNSWMNKAEADPVPEAAPARDTDENYGPVEKDYADPDWALMQINERWELVSPILKEICNERERAMLQWVYQCGFSYEQIGSMVVPSVTREAVRCTCERALRKVRNELFRRKKLYS